jgi:NAD(P)H-hydrate epimerase
MDDFAGLKTEGGFVYLTAKEMAEADQSAIEDYGMDVLSLMENAGSAVATLARKMLAGEVRDAKVCCLVGKGNNGGDGLVAARRLRNWGAAVEVVLAGDRGELKEVPGKQLAMVERMGIPVQGPKEGLGKQDLVVDALLGYSSKGDPRGGVAELIRRAKGSQAPILAVDIPSGLDATTGEPGEPCISAQTTVTFGFPKTGFLNPSSRSLVGELYLADISLPNQIYRERSQKLGFFEKSTLIRI